MISTRLPITQGFLIIFTFGMMGLSHAVVAQDKISLQVKTFDPELRSLPNVEIAFNDLDYFTVGARGTAFVEVSQAEMPIRAVRLKDERFEAASWNLSKGTIEIIVRPVSYKVMQVSARFADGTALANTPITFLGSTTMNLTSDQSGKFDLPVSIYENVSSASQFRIDNLLISGVTVNDNLVTLIVERPHPKESEPQRDAVATSRPDQPAFDIARLDSIGSLAEFYAIFRNISMNSQSDEVRKLIDEKFKQLVAERQDSIRASQPVYIRDISDSSMVVEDIRNLLRQATAESNTLRTNRADFENKIVVISSKLQRGVVNLSEQERNSLLNDIDRLEQLLTGNESQFYENHNDYREIINTLREKYLDIQRLQTRLSEVERLKAEQDKEFRQRLIGIGAVVVVFGFLIILLVTTSSRVRRQSKSLKAANERIEQINENLEVMVAKRTHLLEEANKELDTFLYRASHDLKSPVRSLMGLSQIIDHIAREEMVQHVQKATDSMHRVITKLVDISEISQEAKNLRTVNIRETINKIRNKHLVAMISANGSRDLGAVIVRKMPVQFAVDCPEDLQIHTSQSLLEIILVNLMDNAIFFGGLKKTGEAVRVEVKAAINNGELTLSVYDNGVGISRLIQPRIFDMFFTGNEGSKGSGLGLYTVRKCVTALHGTITFESEEGKFTRFTVVIPPSEPINRPELKELAKNLSVERR